MSGKGLLTRFTVCAFCKLSVFVYISFPFDSEGRIWDLMVSFPDHCLPFYIVNS